MPSSIYLPKSFSPQQLDQALANGWRPMGQRIYISDFIQLDIGEIYSVVPTRLPLATFRWKKGQRKLMRVNDAVFRAEIRPAFIDHDKRRVNDLYLLEHPTKSTESLDIHLEHEGQRTFNTMECAIYHKDRLVAFSFFDCGERSAYSKAGIYDPGYARFSLGMYSMYLEIAWCLAQGFQHYYPGYISPELPLFHYKTRIGDIEFWHQTSQQWLPFADFEGALHSPMRLLEQHTRTLVAALEQADIVVKPYVYPPFEMQMIRTDAVSYLHLPIFVSLLKRGEQGHIVAIYNLDTLQYECWACTKCQIYTYYEPQPNAFPLYRALLRRDTCLFASADTAEFVQQCQQLQAPYSPPDTVLWI